MKKAPDSAVGSESHLHSQPLAIADHPCWLRDLERLVSLEKSFVFLPVGWGSDKKAPMLKGWPSHPGFTTKQLLEVRDIRSVGAKTGMNNGPLLCFDIDGTSALKLACSLGLDPLEVRTWQVHRDNNPSRLKVLFRPTPQQIAQLTEGEFQSRAQTAEKTETNKGEALGKVWTTSS